MKRIIVCMDGTWQTLSQDTPTNIALIARSVAHTQTIQDKNGATRKIPQVVIYTSGVGSTVGALADRGFLGGLSASLNRMAGGAFGEGLEDGIVDTYVRLAFNYEAGDEIYIFGFSRGAFAARRLAGFINAAGVVSRRHVEKAWMGFRLYQEAPGPNASDEKRAEHSEAERQFRLLYGKGDREMDGTRRQLDTPPPITYLGVFDTVVQRGFWDVVGSVFPWVQRRYRFRNLHVCSNVLSARHAVAMDETRLGFPSTLWEGLREANATAQQRPDAKVGYKYFEQRWFVGTHGDVGGGDGSKLAANALKWIAEGAAAQGLRFYGVHGADRSPMDDVLHDAGDCFDAPITWPKLTEAWQPINYPIRSRKVWASRENPTEADIDEIFHPTVWRRATADYVRPRYRPGGLRPFRKFLKKLVQPPSAET